MNNTIFKILSAITLSATSLCAAEKTTTAETQNNAPITEEKAYLLNNPTHVILNGTSFLLKGYGIKLGYGLTSNLLVLGTLDKVELSSSSEKDLEDLGYSYKHTIHKIGAGITLYPFTEINKNGLYITTTYSQSDLKTNVKDTFFKVNSEAKNKKSGLSLTAGYQFTSELANDKLQLLLQFGAGYGESQKVEWQLFGANNDLKPGLILDIQAGVQF